MNIITIIISLISDKDRLIMNYSKFILHMFATHLYGVLKVFIPNMNILKKSFLTPFFMKIEIPVQMSYKTTRNMKKSKITRLRTM